MAGKNTIGSRIVIEGAAEYNKSIREIKAEHAELRSEMKLCEETYKESANTMEALKEKHEILTKQIETQNRQVESQKKILESANKAQKEAEERVQAYEEALSAAQKELKEMEESSSSTTDALEAQRREVEDLENKLTLSQQSYEKAEAASLKYQTALNLSQAELKKLEGELERTDKYMEEAEESSDNCAKSIDEYGKTVKNAGENTKDFGKRSKSAIDELAKALAAAGIAKSVSEIAKELMECSKAAAAFETSMTQVYTIADQSVLSQKEMSEQILASSTMLIQSADDMAAAAYQAISAGVDTADAVGFVETATRLAVGGFTDSTTAVDILTTTLNAYNLTQEETVAISDMLITTQNEGKTTVSDLAGNMGRVIPLAAAYNVNMANLSTTYAKLTANGIKTAEATTYIKGMLNELGDSGSKVSKILEEQTGKSFADLMEDGYSLGEVLDILGQSVDGDSGAFNELWSSSEAGIGALSLLGSGVDEFNRVLNKMESSTGATQQAFDKMTDTTEYAEKRMQNAIANLKIAIGEELNPELKNLYNFGADAFEWAAEFVQEHPELVKAITAVVTVLGTVVVAIGAVTVAVTVFNAVMEATNPVLLALTAAVGAFVGIAAAIAASTERVETELQKEIATTKEAVEATKENVDAVLDEIEANNKRLQKERELIKSIEVLNSREDLSIEEKAELRAQVDMLNNMVADLNLTIDEQTGYLDAASASFSEYAKELVNAQEYEQNLASNTDLYAAKEEAAENLTKALQEQEEAYKVLQQTAEEGYLFTAFGTAYYKNYDEIVAMAEAYGTACENVENCQAAVAAANAEYESMAEYLESVRVATEENNLVQIEYKGIMTEVTSDVAANIQNLEAAYTEAKTAAEDSLKSQVGLFEELSTSSDLTAKDMAANLQSQADAFNQYKEDLLAATELVQRGLLDEGLLGSLQELGMNGAGYMHELVTASQEDAEAYAEVIANYQEMVDARAALAETMGDLTVGYTDQIEELLGVQTDAYGTMLSTTDDAYAELQTKVEEALAQLVTTEESGVQDMADCITEKVPVVKEATESLFGAAIEGAEAALVVVDDGHSEVFRNLGYKIPESVAEGIRDGQELVSGAVQDVIDNAIASANMSGIAAQIDIMLGKALE